MRDDLRSMLLARQVDFTADYVRRGRAHRHLADADLIEAWQAAFRAYSRKPGLGPLRSAEQDFLSELSLRNIDPPFDVVAEDMERLRAAAKEVHDRIKADPESLEEVELDLRADLAAFRSRRDRSKS